MTEAQLVDPVKFGLIRYEYAPGEITALCDRAETEAAGRLDSIVSVNRDRRNFDNTMLAFEKSIADLLDKTNALSFMNYVSLDEKLRAEGAACEERLGKFIVSVLTRKDLYNALRAVKPRNSEEARLQKQTLKKFEKNGLKLPDEKLAQVKERLQQLATLQTQFTSNLNNDTSTVEFTTEELEGAPATFLQRLKKTPDGNEFIVTTKSTDYAVVSENAKSSETRRRMYHAYMNRAADQNTKLLEQAIGLRRQTAPLIGYDTWADYRIDGRMAKNAPEVQRFLDDLRGRLAKRNEKDLARLLKYKKELDPRATAVEPWDINYLAYQLRKRDYEIDNEKIREYFPAGPTVQGMFNIYSKLFSVQFIEVKKAKVWSPDVKLYEIWDGPTGNIIAYFYADFVPRAGKYGHAAAFPLVSGRKLANGRYSKPVAAIVANFTPPSDDRPSLLTHGEVETLFHEFGHIIHQTLTRAPYASLSGTEVAQDFVEAPSQMLEEWVWSPKILKELSGHYKDPEKKLPDSTIRQLIRARDFNEGYFYTRQLLFGLLDMTYHTNKPVSDPITTYHELFRNTVGIEPMKTDRFPAVFGHLMGGYDAGYYGYLWSEVYALDMASRFKKGGMLNSKLGMEYRRNILERGDMSEGKELVTKFLKRKPSTSAFFQKLGIGG